MIIRNITETEIGKFTSLSKDSVGFERAIKSLWEDGSSSPQWCFIIEENDVVIGRIGFWAAPENKKDIHIFGLTLPLDREDVHSIGQNLFKDSLKEMKTYGVETVDCQMRYSNSKDFEVRIKVMEDAGLKKIQSKKSLVLSKNDCNIQHENILTYKTLTEVGEEKFIKAIKEVTKDTLDQEDKLSIEKIGLEETAIDYFKLLKSIEFSQDDWFLGYDKDKLVGLVVPQIVGEKTGAINYIGVVKEFRGNNFIEHLLSKGVRNLFDRDVEDIVADIDEANFPMDNVLMRKGFEEDEMIFVYKLVL